MRDPKRIDETLSIIKSIWVSHPDMRLMQLLGNCFSGEVDKDGIYVPGDTYNVEEDELVAKLKATYLNQETTTGGW